MMDKRIKCMYQVYANVESRDFFFQYYNYKADEPHVATWKLLCDNIMLPK